MVSLFFLNMNYGNADAHIAAPISNACMFLLLGDIMMLIGLCFDSLPTALLLTMTLSSCRS